MTGREYGRFLLLTALIVATPLRAWAHPEGFSGLHITIEAESATAALSLHTRDLGGWFPPGKHLDYVADVCRELQRLAAEILEVRWNDAVIEPTAATATLVEVGLIELKVTWLLPTVVEPAELFVWSKQLHRLPRGHQQLLFVEDQRGLTSNDEHGKLLLEDVLAVEHDAGSAEVLPVGDETPARTADNHDRKTISFFWLGVEHILTGYDHLLFLAGLLLTCATLTEAVKIITCFTVAHSITLALAALDVVQLSAGVVEPAIAASIVYVALENLLTSQPRLWRRVVVTFCFGLIHGLGFASVLRDIGLGTLPGGVAWPLLRFNLGVEAGQIAVAVVFLQLVRQAWRHESLQPMLVRWGSVIIALFGGYWFAARIAAQWWSG